MLSCKASWSNTMNGKHAAASGGMPDQVSMHRASGTTHLSWEAALSPSCWQQRAMFPL